MQSKKINAYLLVTIHMWIMNTCQVLYSPGIWDYADRDQNFLRSCIGCLNSFCDILTAGDTLSLECKDRASSVSLQQLYLLIAKARALPSIVQGYSGFNYEMNMQHTGPSSNTLSPIGYVDCYIGYSDWHVRQDYWSDIVFCVALVLGTQYATSLIH